MAVAGDIWVVTARQKVPLVPSEQRLSTPQSTGGPHSTAPRPRTPAAPRLRTLLRGQENIRESTGRADDPVEGPWVLVTKHCHPVGEVSVLFSKRSCVVSERTETGKGGGRVRARQADLPLACAPPPPCPAPGLCPAPPGSRAEGLILMSDVPTLQSRGPLLEPARSHPLVPRSDTSRWRQDGSDTLESHFPIMNVTFSNFAKCFQKQPLSPKHQHPQTCCSLKPGSWDLQRLVVTKRLHPRRRPQPSRRLSPRRHILGPSEHRRHRLSLLLPAGAQTW